MTSSATFLNSKNRLTRFTIKREEREKNKEKKRKRSRRYTEISTMTSLVLLERYQRDESNNIKEGHERWS